ncbi:MAG: leucine-rich repeat domain-containing protein [Sphingobacteriales bacterium]|nr:MAG: leucine-rich repeat domain-containing protein [Sphingobacteriales bacterium]
MKKYLFLACILSSGFAFAQQKRPIKKPVPLKVTVPQPVEASSGDYGEQPVVMPASAMVSISATKKNGDQISFSTPEALAQADLSQFKTLSITTRHSDKILDRKVLQQIIDAAKQLESLTIENFTIEAFPDITTPHLHLKKLVLTNNKLNTLPASISNLSALEALSSSNPLKELPASFSALKNMKELGLHYTWFTSFPMAIFSLNKLSVLYVSGARKGTAKIKELPDLFQQLPELKELGITNASLVTLPASISRLPHLNKVDFSYNLFTEFPAALANNAHLSFVPFSSNPLKWNAFLASIKKIKWHGLFFLHETGLSRQQYETVQRILSKTDVYYDGMND